MKYTNKHKLPKSLVDLVENMVYDPRESDPKRIGITTLIQNPRIKLLTLAHWEEIETDVSDYLWLLLVNAVHYVLGKIEQDREKSSERLIEEKLVKVIDGITIVGKLDLYEYLTGSIEDWKITSVWSVRFGDHDNWEEQLNPYAWLVQDAGFPVKQLRINAILRDFKKSDRLRYADYPRVPFVTIPIKLWTPEEQLDFIKQRIEIFKSAMSVPLDELPICSPKERWKKDDAYAVYKNTNKSAARVLHTAEEADKWLAKNNDGKSKYRIEKRCGTDMKCQEYCNVNKFCSYWQETYGDKK